MLIIRFLQGRRRQKKQPRPQNPEPSKGRLIVGQIHKTIVQYFPDLFERLDQFADPRLRRNYSISELLTAGICLFIFRQGSRNEMNLSRKEDKFRRNYQRIFRQKFPHMDTVDALLRELDEEELEKLKSALVSVLIEKKVLYRWRLLGRSYVISIDGTHVNTYPEDYCGECTWKTVNKGKKGEKKVFFHTVLEAKLVTASGLSISIASEWIANTGSEYVKQDCEIRAFVRLAAKIKRLFPRLPICITGDALYPNATVFAICEQNGWDYVITFKDTNLTSIWEEIGLLPQSAKIRSQEHIAEASSKTTITYQYINDLDYKNRTLNWLECLVEKVDLITGEITQNRFVHITNLHIEIQNAPEISRAGRMRWKIENEGFNIQKNNGYELGHKFSEVSFLALKNYYQCMQIAHMINQLVEHSTTVRELMQADKTLTIKFLWRKLISFMDEGEVGESEFDPRTKQRTQIRLV